MFSTLHSIPVLCFHDIATPEGMSLNRFCAHLDTICEMGFHTISAQNLLAICRQEAPLRGKPIVVTFDDCHVSNWLYAVPELKQRGMKGVFFAITDFIHSGPIRTTETAPLAATANESFARAIAKTDFSQFMTREELVATVCDHNMEVYSHTSRHQGCFKNLSRAASPPQRHWSVHGIYNRSAAELPVFAHGSAYAYNGYWPKRDNPASDTFHHRTDQERFDFCVQDFRASIAIIRKINKQPRQFLCWPWGHFDHISLEAASKAGYKATFTLERGFVGPGSDPMRICRIPVGSNKKSTWLKQKLLLYNNRITANIFRKNFRKR